jgi:hypothetical protein
LAFEADRGYGDKLRSIKYKNLLIFLFVAFMLQVSSFPQTAVSFTNLEILNYKACFDGVPLREYPDKFAPRMATVPKGKMVRVDIKRGEWLRVIYKVPNGYFIGWSLATMMCPAD